MNTDDLDQLILLSLDIGPCPLPELARRANYDARMILKRLHILGSHGKVGTQMANGSVEWMLKGKAPSVDAGKPPAGKPLEQPAPNPKPSPEVAPVQPKPKRKKDRTVVVREKKRVLELSITQINDGDVVIVCENEEKPYEPDEIFVPAEDLPALIRALTDVVAQAQP